MYDNRYSLKFKIRFYQTMQGDRYAFMRGRWYRIFPDGTQRRLNSGVEPSDLAEKLILVHECFATIDMDGNKRGYKIGRK